LKECESQIGLIEVRRAKLSGALEIASPSGLAKLTSVCRGESGERVLIVSRRNRYNRAVSALAGLGYGAVGSHVAR